MSNMTRTKFLDPEAVLFQSGVKRGATVVDLGAGSGYFAVAAANAVSDSGQVFVVDVLESSLEHVTVQGRLQNCQNIKTIRHDLETGEIKQIPSGCADLVIAANLMHQIHNPQIIMTEIYRILKTSGKLLVIDWNGRPTSIGPKAVERISEDKVKSAALGSHLKFESNFETDQFHFGLLFQK